METKKVLRTHFDDNISSMLSMCSFFAIPGVLTLSVQAYGLIPAMLMCVYGIQQWNLSLAGHRRSIVWSGLLLGLAFATRVEFLIVIPSMVAGFAFCREKRKAIIPTVSVIGISLISFSLLVFALSVFSPNQIKLFEETGSDIGLTNILLNYVSLFRKWEVVNGFLPIPLAVGSSIVPLAFASKQGSNRHIILTVLASAWILLLSWLFLSPIPHLRYIWLSLFIFLLSLGLGVGKLYAWSVNNKNRWLKISAIIVSLAFLLSGFLSATRQIASGDSDILSWEWSRETELQPFSAFHQASDQKKFAMYLKQRIPPGENIAVFGSSITFGYLTQLECIGFLEWAGGLIDINRLPQFLVIDPMIGTYLYPDAHTLSTLIDNSEEIYSIGKYSLLKVKNSVESYDKLFNGLSRGYTSPFPETPRSDP